MTLPSKRAPLTERSGDDRPTVLLLGRGDPMADALVLALERNGVAVERAETVHAVDAVFVGAPDLVLLLGDAAGDEGSAVLAKLANHVATAVVPVAVLSNDADLDHRLRAFRFGAVAVVERSASADAMARRIAELAHELPERSGETAGELGEASIDEVVELFSHRLRSGILAVTAAGSSGEGARIVLRGDRPVTQAIEEFVDRIRPLVSRAEPLVWEFQETPTGKLRQLELDDPSGVDVTALLADLRIVLVERSPARADELVQALRQRGAHVVVIDGEGIGLAKARAIDPDVIVVDVEGIGGWASTSMRAIRRDARLRWASLLVVRAHELWPESAPEPDVERLAAGLAPLIEPDAATERRAVQATAAFDLRMETTGPARMLRALAKTGRTLHLSLRHRRASITIDLAQGLLVGASAKLEGGKELAGTSALAALLALGSGRVRVEPREAPSLANVMSPIDDALAAADREPPPLRPSLPPASIVPPPRDARAAIPAGGDGRAPTPAAGVSRPSDPQALVHQLESLLGKLRATLPPAAARDVEAIPVPRQVGVPKPGPREKKKTMVGVAPPVVPAPVVPIAAAPIAPRPARLPAIAAEILEEEPTRQLAAGEMGALTEAARTEDTAPATSASVAEPLPTPGRAPRTALPAPRMPVAAVPPLRSAPEASIVVEGGLASAPAQDDVAGVFSIPEIEVEAIEPPPFAAFPFTSSRSAEELVESPPRAPRPVPKAAPVAPEEATPVARPGAQRASWLVPLALLGGAAIVSGVALAAWGAGLIGAHGAEITQLPIVPPPLAAREGEPGAIPEAVANPEPVALAGTSPQAEVVMAPDPAVEPELAPEPEPEPQPQPDPATELELELAAEAAPDVTESDEPEAAADPGEVNGRPLPDHLVARANFRRTHGDLPGAETDYLRVLRLEPRNARAIAGLTRLYMARNDPRAAAQWARRLVAVRSSQPANHVLLGDALAMAGDRAGARRAWEHALQLSPGDRDARRRLDAAR